MIVYDTECIKQNQESDSASSAALLRWASTTFKYYKLEYDRNIFAVAMSTVINCFHKHFNQTFD